MKSSARSLSGMLRRRPQRRLEMRNSYPPFVLQDLLAREAAAARIANLEAQVVTLRRGQAATAQAWKEDATVSMAHSPYSGVNFLLGSAGARVAEVGFGTAVGNWREAADVVLYHHLGVALLGDATKNLPQGRRNNSDVCTAGWAVRA